MSKTVNPVMLLACTHYPVVKDMPAVSDWAGFAGARPIESRRMMVLRLICASLRRVSAWVGSSPTVASASRPGREVPASALTAVTPRWSVLATHEPQNRALVGLS